ncbi:hypothetical protein NPIL_539641, partial [Nephila pilipes]
TLTRERYTCGECDDVEQWEDAAGKTWWTDKESLRVTTSSWEATRNSKGSI